MPSLWWRNPLFATSDPLLHTIHLLLFHLTLARFIQFISSYHCNQSKSWLISDRKGRDSPLWWNSRNWEWEGKWQMVGTQMGENAWTYPMIMPIHGTDYWSLPDFRRLVCPLRNGLRYGRVESLIVREISEGGTVVDRWCMGGSWWSNYYSPPSSIPSSVKKESQWKEWQGHFQTNRNRRFPVLERFLKVVIMKWAMGRGRRTVMLAHLEGRRPLPPSPLPSLSTLSLSHSPSWIYQCPISIPSSSATRLLCEISSIYYLREAIQSLYDSHFWLFVQSPSMFHSAEPRIIAVTG